MRAPRSRVFPRRALLISTAGALLVALLSLLEPPRTRGAFRLHPTRHTRHRLRSPAIQGTVRALGGEPEVDPPEVSIGERLFLETRFAQFFAANLRGDVNRSLAFGDPVMDATKTTGPPLPGAFAGKAMNCRACHFVDDVAQFPGGRVNTYGDFARRSPVPAREDGRVETPRNSPPLVNAFLPRSTGLLLHFDGEFATVSDLVKATLAGRNFGWLPGEDDAATAHIARVIREDDGADDLGRQYAGLPYRVLFQGTDSAIPPDLRLPETFRLEVARRGDRDVLGAVSRLITAYSESLVFSQDEDGYFNGSPYDAFLSKNGLPRAPEPNESDDAYASRLRSAVKDLDQPLFVQGSEGMFVLHDQSFLFGRKELDGLQLFLKSEGGSRSPAGNCVACHPPPNFTDFRFHNTGASQEEYDAVHGADAFSRLPIPDLSTRRAGGDRFLPPNERRPGGTGVFRARTSRERPGEADLGLWNVYANPDFPAPQGAIESALGLSGRPLEEVLPRTIALFKTPTLRDLGQSAPYLHSGRMTTLDEVLRFYVTFSQRARLGRVRNASPEIARIFLTDGDAGTLAAFLRSLNEDYQ